MNYPMFTSTRGVNVELPHSEDRKQVVDFRIVGGSVEGQVVRLLSRKDVFVKGVDVRHLLKNENH